MITVVVVIGLDGSGRSVEHHQRTMRLPQRQKNRDQQSQHHAESNHELHVPDASMDSSLTEDAASHDCESSRHRTWLAQTRVPDGNPFTALTKAQGGGL
jgi:hypothetical protein